MDRMLVATSTSLGRLALFSIKIDGETAVITSQALTRPTIR
jgi:hypothetical protein